MDVRIKLWNIPQLSGLVVMFWINCKARVLVNLEVKKLNKNQINFEKLGVAPQCKNPTSKNFCLSGIPQGCSQLWQFKGNKSVLGGQISYSIYITRILISILYKKYALEGRVRPREHGWYALYFLLNKTLKFSEKSLSFWIISIMQITIF